MVRPSKRKASTSKVSDFKHIKKKVGKKAPRALNATDTSFKSRSVVVREQSVTQDKGSLVTHRNQSLSELFSLVRHHNASQRRDALLGIVELVESNETHASIRANLFEIVQRTVDTIHDADGHVRSACLRLLETLFKTSSASGENTSNHGQWFVHLVPLALNHCCVGMASLHLGVRVDSVKAIGLLVHHFPQDTVRDAPRLVHLCTSVLRLCLEQPTASVSNARLRSLPTGNSAPTQSHTSKSKTVVLRWAVVATVLVKLFKVLAQLEDAANQEETMQRHSNKALTQRWTASNSEVESRENVKTDQANSTKNIRDKMYSSLGSRLDLDVMGATQISEQNNNSQESTTANLHSKPLLQIDGMKGILFSLEIALQVWAHVLPPDATHNNTSKVKGGSQNRRNVGNELAIAAQLVNVTIKRAASGLHQHIQDTANPDEAIQAFTKCVVEPLSSRFLDVFPLQPPSRQRSGTAEHKESRLLWFCTNLLVAKVAHRCLGVLNDANDRLRTKLKIDKVEEWATKALEGRSYLVDVEVPGGLMENIDNGSCMKKATTATLLLHELLIPQLEKLNLETPTTQSISQAENLVLSFSRCIESNLKTRLDDMDVGESDAELVALDANVFARTLMVLLRPSSDGSDNFAVSQELAKDWTTFLPRFAWALSSAAVEHKQQQDHQLAKLLFNTVEIALQILHVRALAGIDGATSGNKNSCWNSIARTLVPMFFIRERGQDENTGEFGPFECLPSDIQLCLLDTLAVLPHGLLNKSLFRAILQCIPRIIKRASCQAICGTHCGHPPSEYQASKSLDTARDVLSRMVALPFHSVSSIAAPEVTDYEADEVVPLAISFSLSLGRTLASCTFSATEVAQANQAGTATEGNLTDVKMIEPTKLLEGTQATSDGSASEHSESCSDSEDDDQPSHRPTYRCSCPCPSCPCKCTADASDTTQDTCLKEFTTRCTTLLEEVQSQVHQQLRRMTHSGIPVAYMITPALYETIIATLLITPSSTAQPTPSSHLLQVSQANQWKIIAPSWLRYHLKLVTSCLPAVSRKQRLDQLCGVANADHRTRFGDWASSTLLVVTCLRLGLWEMSDSKTTSNCVGSKEAQLLLSAVVSHLLRNPGAPVSLLEWARESIEMLQSSEQVRYMARGISLLAQDRSLGTDVWCEQALRPLMKAVLVQLEKRLSAEDQAVVQLRSNASIYWQV